MYCTCWHLWYPISNNWRSLHVTLFSMHSCFSWYHYVILLRVYDAYTYNFEKFPKLTKFQFHPHHLGVFNGFNRSWHHTLRLSFPNWSCPRIYLMKNMFMYAWLSRICSCPFLNENTGKNTLVPGCGQISCWSFHRRLIDILKRLIFFSVLCILSLVSLPWKYILGKVTSTINIDR